MSDERKGLPSASSFRRYELCHGSWQLEQEAKRLGQEAHKSSPAAARGSLIHAWLARLPDEDGSQIKLTEPEQRTADFLQARAEEQIERIFHGDQVDTLIEKLVEKRLWLTVDGSLSLSGQFDKVVYSGDTALVIDFKSGFSEPDPAEINSQLKVLAVLVALHLPHVAEVIVQIISGPHGVTEARYTIQELAHAYNEILDTLRAIHAESAPFNPSPEACRYCPAVLICPAFKKQMLEPVQKQQLVELPTDPEEVSALLDRTEAVIRYAGQVKEFYAQRLTDDPSCSIPGWGMVPNAARREIENVEMARRRLSEYLDESELNTVIDLKVGQVEKLFGKKLGLRGKELRSKFNAVMEGVIVEKIPSPSLKRASEKPSLVEI